MRQNHVIKSFIVLLTLLMSLLITTPVFAAEKNYMNLTLPDNNTTINNPELNYSSNIFRNQIPIKFKIQGVSQNQYMYVMYVTEVGENGKYIKPIYMRVFSVSPSDVYTEKTIYIPSTFALGHYYKVEVCSINSGPVNSYESCGYFQY